MKVKICGITDKFTAQFAVSHGADALGFVFAESKRRISPKQAKEIIAGLPENVLKVGVFVNENRHVIRQVVEETGLTTVQLHGDERPEACEGFSVPVIKAFSLSAVTDLEQITKYRCDTVLLDSPRGAYYGGNGMSFNWNLLKNTDLQGRRVILAGGLNPSNVEEAIQLVKPFMVDVSSGVESEGKKDKEKIRSFIEKAKRGKMTDEHLFNAK